MAGGVFRVVPEAVLQLARPADHDQVGTLQDPCDRRKAAAVDQNDVIRQNRNPFQAFPESGFGRLVSEQCRRYGVQSAEDDRTESKQKYGMPIQHPAAYSSAAPNPIAHNSVRYGQTQKTGYGCDKFRNIPHCGNPMIPPVPAADSSRNRLRAMRFRIFRHQPLQSSIARRISSASRTASGGKPGRMQVPSLQLEAENSRNGIAAQQNWKRVQERFSQSRPSREMPEAAASPAGRMPPSALLLVIRIEQTSSKHATIT